MGKKLYIGNLSYDVSSSDLEALLSPHGTVQSAEVIMDRSTGQSKGFGFVEIPAHLPHGFAGRWRRTRVGTNPDVANELGSAPGFDGLTGHLHPQP